MKLTIIRGLPGSGKSTYAKTHFNCLILENDMFQISDGEYRWTYSNVKNSIDMVAMIAEDVLNNGNDVVIANTFTRKHYVDFYKNLAEDCGAKFEVIRMNNVFENIHNVPKETLQNMKDNFEDYEGETIIKND